MAFLCAGKLDKQTVYIPVNGQEAGKWEITKPGFQEQTLTLSETLFTKPDRMVIIFKTPDAISPAQLGISNDKRSLGIAVRALELSK